jgi:hypothetical protein
MGIGIDTMNTLISAVAGDPSARAEIADAVNRGNEALRAIDLGSEGAKQVFAQSKPAEFEAVRAAEVARRLDAVVNAKADATAADAVAVDAKIA